MRRAALPLLLSLTAAAAAPRPAPPPAMHDFAAERARLQALNAQEAALAARIGANRTSLLKLLGALEMWRRDPPPALLVSPKQARDAARAAILMRAVAPELQRRARALSVQAQALARVRRQAAEAGERLFAAESAGAEKVGAEKVGAEKAGAESARGGDPLLSVSERAAVDRARGDPLALGAGAEPPPDAAPPRLRSPLAGLLPSHRFGEVEPGRGRSEGWAWVAPPDAPVLSPADGEVEYAGPLRSWRLVAILRLPGGWRVVLAGLQAVTAPVGAQVREGEPIGRAPAAGASSNTLRLELRRGATPVDPAPAFAAAR